MTDEGKPEVPREVLRLSSTEDKIPSKTRKAVGKMTVPVTSEVRPATSQLVDRDRSLPITLNSGGPAHEAPNLVVNPELPPVSKDHPQTPRDEPAIPAQAASEKTARKHDKRRRSSVKPRQSSEEKEVVAGRVGTGRIKRRKQKSAEGEAGHPENKEGALMQAQPAPTSETEMEPMSKQGRRLDPAGECKPEAATSGEDLRKQESQNTDYTPHVGPPPFMSSASALNNHQAEKVKGGEGGRKETNGSRYDDVNVDAHATEPPKEKGENVQGKTEEERTEDRLKDDASETRKKPARMLKRMSCVSFQPPQEDQGSHVRGSSLAGTPPRRLSRFRMRKSDGELHSLYSVVALKDLATTLRVSSVERIRPSNRQTATLRAAKYRTWVILIAVACVLVALTLVLWIRSLLKPVPRSVCGSIACAELSAAFEGVLNYSVDPCVDLDAFVCSKGNSPGSGFDISSHSSVAHYIKEYQLTMVELFLSGEPPTFMASRVVTDFLRECTDISAASASEESLIDFFDLMSVPWPFGHSGLSEMHPLEAVLTLSLTWGIDTWFRAYVQTPHFSGAPGLFIEASGQASTWLEYVQILDRVGGREKYLQLFHERYNVSLPTAEGIALWLTTEKEVLSILDAARSPENLEQPAIAHLAKIAAHVRNSTVDNWLTPVTEAPGGNAVDESTLVSVQGVHILRMLDQLLYKYSAHELMHHLSWWLLQIFIVIGSPQDYILIAGSREFAAKEVNVECYRMAAARFGLLLTSESSVRLFTRNSRRELEVFLRGLLDMLGGLAANATRISDSDKVAIARRIQDLDVALWPLKVDGSNETLWQLYGNFCISCKPLSNLITAQAAESETNATNPRAMLMDLLLHANTVLWSFTADQRERMQLQWQHDTLDAFRYEPLTNRLRVSHAALRRPFYHPASEDVLPANLGGLGASFLNHALRMFVAPAAVIELGVSLSTWPDVGGVTALAKSPNCSGEALPNLLDVFALALSWHALQTTAGASSEGDHRYPSRSAHLAIRDEHHVTHFYSGDQLFFLSYCRSRCAGRRRVGSSRGPDCNAAVRSIADFGRTFNCTPGSPMVPRNACNVLEFF